MLTLVPYRSKDRTPKCWKLSNLNWIVFIIWDYRCVLFHLVPHCTDIPAFNVHWKGCILFFQQLCEAQGKTVKKWMALTDTWSSMHFIITSLHRIGVTFAWGYLIFFKFVWSHWKHLLHQFFGIWRTSAHFFFKELLEPVCWYFTFLVWLTTKKPA